MRVSRSFAFGIGLAALAIAADLRAPVLAANATLQGQAMPPGFGRLSLSFDEPTVTRIRVANGVLVVAFDSPVTVDVAKIAKDLPDYVSVARIDPDRRGLRFALTRPFRANLIETGDKAFIDLLSENWRGMLPGPPPEVLAEMNERLRLAEARAREVARRPAAPPAALGVRGASLPTLERLTFKTPAETALSAELADGTLNLSFDRAMTVDPAVIRRSLPEGVALISNATEDGTTKLALSIPKDWQYRSFDDEDGLTLDLLRPIKPNLLALPGLQNNPQPPASGQAPETPKAPPAGEKPPPANAAQPGAPAPVTAPAAVAAPAPAPAAAPAPQPVTIVATGDAQAGRIEFRFPRLTGAAAFLDAGILTLVFDTRDMINPAELKSVLPGLVEDATVTREGKVTLVRLRLARQQLARLVDSGPVWTLALGSGDVAGKPAEAVAPLRGFDDRGQTAVTVPLPAMTGVHWLEPGPSGAPIAVATAFGPAHTVAKPYQFVEFGLLQTAHGIAVFPRSDDLVVRAGTDQALIGLSGGLTVTLDVPAQAEEDKSKAAAAPPPLLNPAQWSKLQTDAVRDRSRELLRDITDSSRNRRSEARLALARFYLANNLASEAAGPLNVLMANDPAMRGNREALFLKGLVAARMHRNADALKAFDAPAIKADPEVGLWRALVEQRLGRNPQALLGFRAADTILDRYPAALQAELRPAMARAALETRDLTIAEREIGKLADMNSDLVDPDLLALLQGMLEDASGKPEAALNIYKPLFESNRRPVAAEAQLRAIRLAQAEKRGEISIDEATARLETVSVIWRGGEIEIEALAELGRLYLDQHRWRDAFMTARRANESFPESPLTRRLHDETAQRFAELFSKPGDDALSRINALALFYDFKEFLPVGRRGDEITRLLADRLVELDLLDQAGEILRYQMDRRLTGAARSTAAAKLAMINLMNAKPAEALRALAATRLLELPADVNRARLLLEAKALSDLSRTDQALELLESERGPEVDRLRADVYWSGRRWREAGEAHERLLGDSWRGTGALSDGERADAMRSAISYVMADEALSLDRLRGKFAGKMSQSSDARTFAFVTGASRARAADIREMARAAASSDTMTDFLSAYRERYPNYSSAVRQRPKSEPLPAAGETGAAEPSQAPGRG